MSIQVEPLRVVSFGMINYTYLIYDTVKHEAILVDPAWERKKIEDALTARKVKLVGILLTHAHHDHVNLAEPLAKKYKAPVYMAAAEIEFYKFKCIFLHPIKTEQVFTLGNISIQPLFTPGHTHCGTSFLIDQHLFCGDTIFIEGCGICSTEGGDPKAMFHSLQRLKKMISPNTLIYPGHSFGKEPGQTFAYVLANNLYLNFDKEESFIAYRMRKNQKGLMDFQ